MTELPDAKQIAVIGGGITGLAAAHRVVELSAETGVSIEFHLYEASSHLGGTIWTVEQEGFLMEEGPDSFITDKPWAKNLVDRLGIGERLIGIRPESRKSFIVSKGRLEPTPEGFHLMAPAKLAPFFSSPLLSPWGKLRAAMEPLIPAKRDEGDESLGDFVTRRFGREALDRMAQPMVAGIYNADPMKLSLAATFPRFLEMEREHGSVIRGMQKRMKAARQSSGKDQKASGPRYGLFASFDGGMQVLPKELTRRIPARSVRLETEVQEIKKKPISGWTLQLESESVDYDAVLLAIPSHLAARLLQNLDNSLSVLLRRIERGSSVTVNLGYREGQIRHPMNGAGFVVPECEGYSLVGCTFSHRKYVRRAPQGFALIRAYLGNDAVELSDSELIEKAVGEVSELLAIQGHPDCVAISRFPKAMPQYHVGHLELIGKIEEAVSHHEGLRVAGSSYHGPGIPDCIHSGERAAEELFELIRGN